MTDTANAPERIWMTAEDHRASWSGAFRAFRCSDLDHSNDDGPNPDYPEYVLATHCDELVAAARAEGAREAQAKLDELRSDRPFIVGWNEGFAEAEYQQAHGKPSDGDLSPQYQHTAKEVAEAQAKIARLTEAAIFLWGLLDDIDTLDDACRTDDNDFRIRARNSQKRRFEVGTTDGYSVTLTALQQE